MTLSPHPFPLPVLPLGPVDQGLHTRCCWLQITLGREALASSCTTRGRSSPRRQVPESKAGGCHLTWAALQTTMDLLPPLRELVRTWMFRCQLTYCQVRLKPCCMESFAA